MKKLSAALLLILGIGIAAAAPDSGSEFRRTQTSSPPVSCTVRMNFWCVVQADASLDMTDLGDYRVWEMASSGSKRKTVSVRENKSCDSPAESRPRRKSEKDERLTSGERRHTVELAISADGACALKIEYVIGNTDLAREARQMAKYRLYLCDQGSCRKPLLDVR